MNFKEFIQGKKLIVGMIHVRALAGTPKNSLSSQEIIFKAVEEAKIYQKHGLNVVAIENMHDLPYTKNIGPEIIALMSIIGKEIKKLGLYCGIQILAAANKEALAVAKAAGLDFVRVEGFVYAHIGDEGYIESCAGDLLRYKKQIGAEDVLIFTDIKKKHSAHALTSDVDIVETAHTAEFFLSDGVIITGSCTGKEASLEEIQKVKEQVNVPLIIGSGITAENVHKFMSADIFIVGSYFKKNGLWSNEIEEDRIESLMTEFEKKKII
ncbi:BtpA/SgcQ family protein [Candidatus Woesearchaeota archaeon]|jgi:uncharacterized protein|nr:BtpA/SgcQ family protein [Candidatus Woesearchaeota archaeon]